MSKKNITKITETQANDNAIVEAEPKEIKQTSLLQDNFEDEFDPEGDGLLIKFDSTKVLDKALGVKPKNKSYSFIRLILIGFGIFLFVVLGALSVGYNLLEFDNPDFINEQSSSQISSIAFTPREKDLRPPNFPNQLEPNPLLKNYINQKRERGFINRVVGISFEFLIIACVVSFLAYLIYRNTDWPFVKNKYVLVLSIILATIIIGTGFLLIFRQDNRIPRAIRGHRDMFREKMFPPFTSPRQP